MVIMFRQKILIRIIFFLCIASCFAWSEKKHRDTDNRKKHSPTVPVVDASEESPKLHEGYESKPKPRFAAAGHASAGDQYILEEDEGHVVGDEEGEFIDEEGQEEEYGEEQDRGYQHNDKKVNDETQKDFKQTGAYQDFSQGGAVFDKHHKDHESENKENEDVKQHDAGEKFGSEALKEHKLGKHKEKSKGHKKYGFKNVYHKEEYGDHKTFHDEFLDNDHFHDYDDKHEHKQMQGGRFAKGYKKSGENKEHDVGDEKHAWGKAGHDGNVEGYYEKGGHLAGHHHGHKKQEGHYESSGRHAKKAAHKVKKGDVPVVSSVYHQGGDQPQYYNQVYHTHNDPSHLHGGAVIPNHHLESYHARNSGAQNGPDKPLKVYPERGFRPAEVFKYPEQRSPVEARRLEVPMNERYSDKDIEKIHQPIKDNQQAREIAPSNEPHSYHYVGPKSESLPKEDGNNKYRQHYEISEPPRTLHHHKHLSAVQPSQLDLPVRHSFQNNKANQHVLESPHSRGILQHPPRVHDHHHFLIRPHNQPDSRGHQADPIEDQGHSKPWWEASSTAKKHHQTRDFNQSPSYQHYGYAEVPEQNVPWRHRQHPETEEYEPAASQHRSGYAKEPTKVEWKRVKSPHRHI